MSDIVRVLVIDDSAYVRKSVSAMLAKSPFIDVVGTARDGAEGLEQVAELQPDVVTCDLNMPVMDGVAFVREQMARRPVPIVIVSIAAESGEQALAALDAGAVDFVQKPTALATEKLMDIGEDLVMKVKAAARARARSLPLDLVSDSAHCRTGLPFSPTMPRPIANTMLKTTICRTSPVAMASMIEVGTMWSRI